jgi:uncharacterized protein YeaO (DUF488 family)
MSFRIKRVYERAAQSDGTRVLVDRLWPRGLRKEEASWAYWMKDVAPGSELRRWFGHDPARFAEFSRRYRAELRETTALDVLRRLGRRKVVTLLYAAHDPRVNHAAVLLSVLQRSRRGRYQGPIEHETDRLL